MEEGVVVDLLVTTGWLDGWRDREKKKGPSTCDREVRKGGRHGHSTLVQRLISAVVSPLIFPHKHRLWVLARAPSERQPATISGRRPSWSVPRPRDALSRGRLCDHSDVKVGGPGRPATRVGEFIWRLAVKRREGHVKPQLA